MELDQPDILTIGSPYPILMGSDLGMDDTTRPGAWQGSASDAGRNSDLVRNQMGAEDFRDSRSPLAAMTVPLADFEAACCRPFAVCGRVVKNAAGINFAAPGAPVP